MGILTMKPKHLIILNTKVSHLKTGYQSGKVPKMYEYSDEDTEFLDGHTRIIPKEIRGFFSPWIAKSIIHTTLEREKILDTVCFNEELWQQHSQWFPKEAAKFWTEEELLSVVDVLRQHKESNADDSKAGNEKMSVDEEMLEIPVPCPVGSSSVSEVDMLPTASRFLEGMKVRVGENTRDLEKVGLEGVLEHVRSNKTCLLKLFDTVTTTLVRTQDLHPVAPDIGDPCKLLLHNETKAAGLMLEFVENDMDFVMVQFKEETACRKVKLDHLCSIQL